MNEQFTAFENRFREMAAAFFREFERTRLAAPEAMERLATPMLEWAQSALGDEYPDRLIEGYCEFVMDVNRAQRNYEQQRNYEHGTFAEVFEKAYSNDEFMDLYHWGVYCSTFVWLHHLKIFKFFESNFLPLLQTRSENGVLLDLGAGSGIWHLLALDRLPKWRVKAVDISARSIELSTRMAEGLPFAGRIEQIRADATQWSETEQMDAGISCFLLEHLERPHELLEALARSLKPGAHAFVTGALTAAELDHIYEFQRESEVILLLEFAGFRVKHMYSAEPETKVAGSYYLPRSLALVVQKRQNNIW